MTEQEFINIYYTGIKSDQKDAIIEMNKTNTLTELAIILQESVNAFRSRCTRMGIIANKQMLRKARYKWSMVE